MFRVIVAGCGSIVNKWMANALKREDVEIVALADPFPENAKALAARYALSLPIFADVEKAIAQGNANLMFDTTPPAVHEAVVVAGLRAGLDVFGEKPMTDQMDSAHRMVAAAEASGKRYFLMQNRRYLHGIRTLRRLIEQGAVGKPYHVSVDMLLGAHFTGFRNQMDHPLIVDMSIHTFDEARYLLSDAKAVSCYCQEYNPPHSWYKGDGGADCIFEMSDGSVLNFRGSWVSRSENTSAHGSWSVSCGEGAACWDGYRKVWLNEAQPVPPGAGYFEEEGLRREIALDTAGREEHDGCLDDMFRALLAGESMQTDCRNNIHSLAMVHAAVESSASGRKVLL